MTVYAGSLLTDIQRLQELGHTVGVVASDDPAGGECGQIHDQRAVLIFATRNDCPIWLLELNRGAGARGEKPDLEGRTRLRALVPPGTPVVVKPHLDDLGRTDLHEVLGRRDISAFVVMGHPINCCVSQTAVGDFSFPGSGPKYRSWESEHGYIVMSCPQILRGGEASWKSDESVWFFSSV